jgi:hypothetical protein
LLNAWVNADAYLRRCFEIRKLILKNSGPSAYLQAQPIFLYPQKWIADNELTLDENAKNLLKSFPFSFDGIKLFFNQINLSKLELSFEIRTKPKILNILRKNISKKFLISVRLHFR